MKINSKLEQSMLEAADGSRRAASEFYLNFLDGPLYIPERFQESPLSDAPEYPDNILNILGIKGKEHNYSPAFSDPNHITSWCGNELKYRQMNGRDVLKILPDGWRLIINPGQEVEKEVSEWEINLLKHGTEGVEEIVSEVFIDVPPEEIKVLPLLGSDYPALKQALINSAPKIKSLNKIYLLKEEGKDTNDFISFNVLIGLEVDDLSQSEKVKREIQAVADICQIGNDPFKIMVGMSVDDNLMLGIFKGTTPIYTRGLQSQLFGKLFGLFKS